MLVPAVHRADGRRASAYLEGWASSLASIVVERFSDVLETLMPGDLSFTEALDVPDLRTVEDFRAAFAGEGARLAAWSEAREREDFRQAATKAGVEAHAEELFRWQRPAIRLRADEYEDPLEVGASKLGGLPDLPLGVPWPSWNDRPLTFVAQFQLAELAPYDTEGALPKSGILSFFYDPDLEAGRGGARVLCSDVPVSELRRASAPDARFNIAQFPEHGVELAVETMLPPIEGPFYRSLAASLKGMGPFADFLDSLPTCWDTERPTHRLLGYATPLQGDPYLISEVESRGETFENWNDEGARESTLVRAAMGWRLLFQIDSEPTNTFLGQDGGYFYFLIRDDALRAHRFDEVWGVMQTH